MYRNAPSKELLGLDDSVNAANLNLIRAANINDAQLMLKAVNAVDDISTLNFGYKPRELGASRWSATEKLDSFAYQLIKTKNFKLLEHLLKPDKSQMELHETN